MKKRLVLVTTRKMQSIGGVERYIRNFVQNFSHPGFELLFLSQWMDEGYETGFEGVEGRFFKTNVETYKNFFRFLNPIRSLRAARKSIGVVIKDMRPDVILTRDWDAVLSVVGENDNIPIYFIPGSLLKMDWMFDRVFGGGLIYRFSRWLQYKIGIVLENMAFYRAKRILVFSQSFKSRIQAHYGIDGSKIIVIPIGINIPPSLENGRVEPGMILAVGRLSKSKNFQTAIEMMTYLNGFRLYIAGGGEEWNNLENMINGLNLHGKVVLLGEKKDLDEYYKKCEVFLHISYYENLGQVLLEAMSHGKPPIVLDPDQDGVHTASDEIITDGYNGFFVKNNPKSIQEKIREVVRLDQKILRQHCYDFVKQFSFQKHIQALFDVLGD